MKGVRGGMQEQSTVIDISKECAKALTQLKLNLGGCSASSSLFVSISYFLSLFHQ